MSAKHIGDLLNLNDNGGLGATIKRSQRIGELTAELSAAIGGDAGASIVSASVDDAHVLCIKTSSSAWAARLRFEDKRLLAAANACGWRAERLKVQVGRP
ncbi:MAG: DciA family protein [Pseudomonadota bacterium]